MTFLDAIRNCIVNKYASGQGRANRQEFFAYLLCFVLFCIIWCVFIILQIDWDHDLNMLDFVLMYIPFLFAPPLVAVSVRRLHDTGKTGWLVLLLLIPFINLFGLALLLRQGEPEPNRFGPVPPHIHF